MERKQSIRALWLSPSGFKHRRKVMTRFVVTFRGCTHVVMAPSRAAAMKVVRELHGLA
jgi:hypothetical protein